MQRRVFDAVVGRRAAGGPAFHFRRANWLALWDDVAAQVAAPGAALEVPRGQCVRVQVWIVDEADVAPQAQAGRQQPRERRGE